MGVAFGDYDNDLREDIVVTNFEDQVNSVYHNDGDGFFNESSYQVGIGYESRPMMGWGVALVDFDNDGWKDLLFSNGHIYENAELLREGSSWAQRKCLHLNRGNGTFGSSVGSGGAALDVKQVGRGLLWGDIDNDGDIDVLFNNIESAPALLINNSTSRHWLVVDTRHPKARTPMIGARIEIETARGKQVESAQGGSSYLAYNDTRVHFGLGDATEVKRVTVHWLGGGSESFGPVPADRMVVLTPGAPARMVELKSRRDLGTLEKLK